MKRSLVMLLLFGLIQPSKKVDGQFKSAKPDSEKVKQAKSYLDLLNIEKEKQLDTVFGLIDKLKKTNENIKTIKVYLKDTSTFEAARVVAPDTVKK